MHNTRYMHDDQAISLGSIEVNLIGSAVGATHRSVLQSQCEGYFTGRERSML